MDSSASQAIDIARGTKRKPASHSGNFQKEASFVRYEEDYEKVNDALQLAWSTLMDEGHYKTSSFYKSVKCLLISWGPECDDLHTEEEVAALASVLKNTCNFKVTRAILTNDPEHFAHLQVSKHIVNFLWNEDGHRTLLLIYYAGHGNPKSSDGGSHGLFLNGKRTHSDDAEGLNEVVWGQIEDNFQHTKADVLEIFDCCYAGDLGSTRQSWGTRSFEFLGACPSGNVTRSPGKESFTTALIWALEALIKEQTRFTLSELSRKIREAPDFPKDQVPVQLDRCGHAMERIVLAPLAKTENSSEAVIIDHTDTGPQVILTLNFVLPELPSEKIIRRFAKGLNRFMFKEQMPVDRIVWGGLSSWGVVQPSAGGQSRFIQAAQMFQHGINRRRSRGKNDKTPSRPSFGFHTPSSTGNVSANSIPGSPSRPQKKVKNSVE